MKYLIAITLIVMSLWMISGCAKHSAIQRQYNYEDGVYRGVFIDGDSIQVNVEIVLKDGIVQKTSFRHLRRDDNYHLHATEEPYRLVIQQYKEALDHLNGKHLETHLRDLYNPENIVSTQVDGYTAATLRSNKIISAIRDALNRGVYSF